MKGFPTEVKSNVLKFRNETKARGSPAMPSRSTLFLDWYGIVKKILTCETEDRTENKKKCNNY